MQEPELIHDWNRSSPTFDWASVTGVHVNDETLRDGLQNPSVVDPPISDKIRLLHLMDDLGIYSANIGLPGAGPRAVDTVTALATEIVSTGLSIRANAAARTTVADIRPIVEVSQSVGLPIQVCAFIGSSPIRKYAEDWTLDQMLGKVEEAVTFAVTEGLSVMMVTEDTTRAKPEDLKRLYSRAIELGAERICLSDTVGHATPDGVRALVRFMIEEVIEPSGREIGVDWHGHRDRGFAIANALAAIEAGATRIHATALGLGERCGNTEMELLLVNLELLGVTNADLSILPEYCRLAANMCHVPLIHSSPVVGRDAFRTGTGVHAAAIMKAEAKGDTWLADRIYSSVPASLVGREQVIEVGPMSGQSNVRHWLRRHGYEDEESLVERIFEASKKTDHTLTEEELEHLCRGT